MFIVNLGEYGITKGNYFLAPGKNVEVPDEMGEYLLKTYTKKHAVHFQKALDAQQHVEVLESVAPVIEKPLAAHQKRKYSKKAK